MITFDPGTGKLRIRVSQEDVSDALKIKELMAHPGWEVFSRELDVIREKLIRYIEEEALDVTRKDLVAHRGSMLKLTRQVQEIGPKIVEATRKFLEDEKEDLKNG